MSRTHVIRIQTSLLIAYDPDKWGDTGRAEGECARIESMLSSQDEVAIEEWAVKKTTVKDVE